jgi:hypothetical protein
MSPLMRWATAEFAQLSIVDATTLDSLIKKFGLLRQRRHAVLGGKVVAMLDVLTRQPQKIWFDPVSKSSEQSWWDPIIELLRSDALLLIDMGFSSYRRFEQLSSRKIWFITRVMRDASMTTIEVLRQQPGLCDRIVRLGRDKHRIDTLMRIVELELNGTTYRYLTNLCDATRLPAEKLAALYRERWRIEDAFSAVKRLLGLAYFHSGSSNAVELQVWSTWLLYAALVDLRDELGVRLSVASAELSLEMIFRALFHFTQAQQRGETDDPVEYLAQKASVLGILKRKRRKLTTRRSHEDLDADSQALT